MITTNRTASFPFTERSTFSGNWRVSTWSIAASFTTSSAIRVTTTDEQNSITSFTQRSATFRTCFTVTDNSYRAHLGGEEVDRRLDAVRSVENSLAMSVVEEGERQRLDRVV